VAQLKFQKQLNLHQPEKGIYGDCFRTCVAIMLGLDAEEVPHFVHADNPLWLDDCRDWLAGRGLKYIQIVYTGELEDVLRCVSLGTDELPYMLTGQSRNGTNHCVVCQGAEIVCDPAIDNSGIVGPTDTGVFYVEFIVREV